MTLVSLPNLGIAFGRTRTGSRVITRNALAGGRRLSWDRCSDDVCRGSDLGSTSGCKEGASAEFHLPPLDSRLHSQISCYLVHSKNSNIAYISRTAVGIFLALW